MACGSDRCVTAELHSYRVWSAKPTMARSASATKAMSFSGTVQSNKTGTVLKYITIPMNEYYLHRIRI